MQLVHVRADYACQLIDNVLPTLKFSSKVGVYRTERASKEGYIQKSTYSGTNVMRRCAETRPIKSDGNIGLIKDMCSKCLIQLT